MVFQNKHHAIIFAYLQAKEGGARNPLEDDWGRIGIAFSGGAFPLENSRSKK